MTRAEYTPAPGEVASSASPVSPFHSGERAIQRALGVEGELARRARKMVRDHLPEQHRRFYAELPFVVAAARDPAGRPWATMLCGNPGFIGSPDPKTLQIEAVPRAGDPLADALRPGSDLGLLGIDLARRRRNRANGRVEAREAVRLSVRIEQTFGNCPQFIWSRDWLAQPLGSEAASPVRSRQLARDQVAWIEGARTFFVATGYRDTGPGPGANADTGHAAGGGERHAFGMDASHRGGPAGFVEVVDANTLRFPDYAGNQHFNTFGNLIRDPRIGLVFPDFEGGGLLHLTGTASIDWTRPDRSRYPDAERLVEVRIEEVIDRARVLPIRWQSTDPSDTRGV